MIEIEILEIGAKKSIRESRIFYSLSGEYSTSPVVERILWLRSLFFVFYLSTKPTKNTKGFAEGIKQQHAQR